MYVYIYIYIYICMLFYTTVDSKSLFRGFELHFQRGGVRQFTTPRGEQQEWREAWGKAVADSGGDMRTRKVAGDARERR